MRLGLCCIFRQEPIKFRACTAKSLFGLAPDKRAARLAEVCRNNAEALLAAIDYCGANGIGCFRINSQILPLKTHPQLGYCLDELPDGAWIRARFELAAQRRQQLGLRLTMHPDQFVVLNSPRPEVVTSSLAELEYQAEFAGWTGVDVVNIHGGGAYGDKSQALERLARQVERLPQRIRERLTLENDDRIYTPADLLPVCRRTGLPLVYDVHHHRCLPDGLSEPEATDLAMQTWNGREPLFHLSSPRDGWHSPTPQHHHDFIDPEDFPTYWQNLAVTIEVEAKAKELAILNLLEQFRKST